MSFNLFRLIYFIFFLGVCALTVRPYDAVSWGCCTIGLMGALWILYWLPYRIMEIQEEYGPQIDAMKDQVRGSK